MVTSLLPRICCGSDKRPDCARAAKRFFCHLWICLLRVVGAEQVLSLHSIRNLNSTPSFSYYQANVFSGPKTWLPWLIGTFNVAFLRKGPRCKYKIKISRGKFGYFGIERGFFAKALPLLSYVLFLIHKGTFITEYEIFFIWPPGLLIFKTFYITSMRHMFCFISNQGSHNSKQSNTILLKRRESVFPLIF